MLKTISNCYRWLFPDRQFFIRQNGAVKFVTFSSFLQFLLVLLLGMAIAWAAFTSNQFFSLQKTVSEKNTTIADIEAQLTSLNQSYQQKQADLEARLMLLNQQQDLMSNLIESMPGTLEPTQIEASTVLAPLPAVANTDSAFTEQLPDDDSQFVPDQEQKPPSTDATQEGDNSQTQDQQTNNVLEKMQQTDEQLVLVDSHLAQSFDIILNKVQQRKHTLQTAMSQSGLSFTIDPILIPSAQGGPLYDVASHQLSDVQQILITELLELKELEATLSAVPNQLPAKDFYISSSFGIRKDPMTGRAAMHKGIDLAGWHKTKIFSPADGVVKRAGNNGGYGRFIEIEHANGFITRYGHLAKINVKKGQTIKRDDVIALMGSTGRSTSTHLHYEVLHNNKHVNPLKLTKAFAHVL
ncbi:hypothetical protein PULV_a0229 [Pseudoalteromonas ulvae UL12]|uniref:M23ase beta-sheet core domain-containing protein n=1 Tax=Pseudoalteromonas ulvae TaxID=107327 RepID=A0A244CUS4_PSEDV|nr:peptidoglycan DD-metalloendopeptidase family protein [Pseudoalteromonas ulvae]MBE0362688.1 hypothetical protein [Pseudoalteromonas ulvae UL12]OUL59367.1 hypothetical protein B1199_03610 [Pseudoalteromonas ulvae]